VYVQAIKLGVMGVTIVAASGDDGANSRNVRTNRGGTCGYVAIFPASSPYVTTVGATQVHGKLVSKYDIKFNVISVAIFSNIFQLYMDSSWYS
jgi:tripeptidyl-peptidase-1